MNKQREALDALEGIHPGNMTPMAEQAWNKAINAIREALAEPEPWMPDDMAYRPGALSMNELPARKPLTDDQINDLELPPSGCNFRDIVRVIERAHGINEP